MTGQKTGGRQAGTPNKVSKELRESLKGLLTAEFEQLPELIKTLPAEKRVELLVKMLPYCLPKVESIAGTYDLTLSDTWSM